MGAIFGIILGLFGTAKSASGSRRAGRIARDIGNFNAGVAEQQAEDALERGREAEDQLRSGVRKLIGAQRAGFAAQNVRLDDGSPVEIEKDTNVMRDHDIERIRVNAGREAWGYKMQAQNYRMGGAATQQQRNAEATSTILGGLGDAFTSYAKVSNYMER